MKPFTALWLLWLGYFVVVEAAAFLTGEYGNTLTGHARLLMQTHPVLAWALPTLVFGLAVHLILEYVR